MKEIDLCGREKAIVDDCDFERVNAFKWYLHYDKRRNTKYAIASSTSKNLPPALSLHRFVLELMKGDGRRVDHRDRNGLNNTRQNLRLCSSSENRINSKISKNNTSGLRGVYFYGSRCKSNPWWASISENSKRKWLGKFKTKEEAGRAYDCVAKRVYGDFACLNYG